MTIKVIAPSDKKSDMTGSYSREGVQIGGLLYCSWRGYATVKAGTTAAELDIVIPSTQRQIANTTGLVIPANAYITSIMMQNAGELTLGAATGKIKFAPSLAFAVGTNFVESSAAASNVLAAADTVAINNAPADFTTVGLNDVTYKLFATDGAAGSGAAASTVTATVDTKIYVVVNFVSHIGFPALNEFPVSAPQEV